MIQTECSESAFHFKDAMYIVGPLWAVHIWLSRLLLLANSPIGSTYMAEYWLTVLLAVHIWLNRLHLPAKSPIGTKYMAE